MSLDYMCEINIQFKKQRLGKFFLLRICFSYRFFVLWIYTAVENSMGLIIDSLRYNFLNEIKENISECHSGIAIEMANFFLSDLESVRDE